MDLRYSFSLADASTTPPEGRDGPDRRRLTRTGRRLTDPKPRCPSCGLELVDGPHGSDEACVAALRAELERRGAGRRRDAAPRTGTLPE